MTETHEQVALITGGGSGVGRASARALAAAGYHVVIAGRRREALQETASQAADPARFSIVTTDVADPESVAALFDQIQRERGRIDLLFNNAGVSNPPVSLEDLTFEDWKHVVDINLNGAFLCAQQAFRMMKQQRPGGGRIINNGSISAHVPRPNSIAYTATKHAITGLTRSLSLDGRPFEITCGQIDIGNAATDMTAKMGDGVRQADGSLAVEPTMDVENVARAVVYMAQLPLNANVPFMTVMANKMPYIGRG